MEATPGRVHRAVVMNIDSQSGNYHVYRLAWALQRLTDRVENHGRYAGKTGKVAAAAQSCRAGASLPSARSEALSAGHRRGWLRRNFQVAPAGL